VQPLRIRSIDAGRGGAMILVFLAHFTEFYLSSNKKFEQLQYISKITHLASPTFMIISGTMLGYLFCINKENFGRTRKKYIDRGIFLLTIAHAVIWISWLPLIQFYRGSHKVIFITDTIGFCLIVGSICIPWTNKQIRLAIALVLYLFSGYVISFHNPQNWYKDLAAELFCGEMHNEVFFDNFPFLPWLSLYLIGTIIGEKLAHFQSNKLNNKINIYLAKIGLLSILSGVLVSILVLNFNSKFHTQDTLNFASFTQKNPPGIIYFLFYSGLGLIMLLVLNIIIEKKYFKVLINILEIIGQTSLFAFILQYYIYFSILIWINPSYTPLWPILFLSTVIIQLILIKIWNKEGCNKYLTIFENPFIKTFFRRKNGIT
jgi:uncharacterized membrane protein